MELFRALAVLAEPPTHESARLADAVGLGALPSADEYTQLFVFELYPYASVYLGPEGMLGGEARDRISGFWRVLGQVPPAESDHLSVMLAFYARLVDLENEEGDARRRVSWHNSRKAFFWEHISSWLPIYLAKVVDVAPPFYKRWGEVLAKALLEQAHTVGPQESLSIHLREQIGLIDPRDNPVDDFLQSILTPIRSGMILTHADLARAARKLDLGLRLGERRFVLRALFAQNPKAILEWLSAEAASWALHRRAEDAALAVVTDNWEARAHASVRLLDELKVDAHEIK